MESVMSWVKLAIEVLSLLLVIVPLGVKLYDTLKAWMKEQNWPKIVGLISDYMVQAEEKLTDGADKKEWVLAMIQTTAKEMNYDLTEAKIKEIGDLIDSMCAMSKKVNSSDTTVEVVEEKGEE